MSQSEQSLAQLRQEIDAIDEQLQQLFNQRAACALQVAEVKKQAAPESTIFYRPEREAQVLKNIMARNKGPLPKRMVASLFREVMSGCLALEQKLSIGTVDKSENRRLVMEQFGQSAEYKVLVSTVDLLAAVQQGELDYVLICSADLPLVSEYQLYICGELLQAENNYFVIGKQQVAPSGEDRTAILFHVNSLAKDLAYLNESLGDSVEPRIDLPVDLAGFSCFSFKGHSSDAKTQLLLADLERKLEHFCLLGSYPRGLCYDD